MNIRPFQAVYPNLELITSAETFFGTVKERYPSYAQDGFFKSSDQVGVYVYHIKTPLGEYTGIINCTDIQDFKDGKVLKHEKTLAYKEQTMMQLVLHNKAMVKPILLAYNENKDLTSFIHSAVKNQKPNLKVTFDKLGEVHSLWSINKKKDIKTISDHFSKIPKVYIADGHHRVASSIALHDAEKLALDRESTSQVLTVYISFDQLHIYDHNRVVDIFGHLSEIDFVVALSKIAKIKRIKSARKPKRKHELTMQIENAWYRISWKAKTLKKYKSSQPLLDTDIFNEEVLKTICGITNVREDSRIKYVSGTLGTNGVSAEMTKAHTLLGVCLYPVSREELKHVADANEVLPPKSTWFEPRIKNGLIVKQL